MLLSLIAPCYNEQEALPIFYREVSKVLRSLPCGYEIIFVDDGSSDSTLDVVRGFSRSDRAVYYISFSRNFGKEAAIYAGLQKSRGDFAVIMDVDMQDPPSLLPEMYRAVTEEGFDSGATRRVSRKGEPPIRSFFARKFYSLMKYISKAEIVDGARDYRMMNRSFVNAILDMKEYNRFSKGLFGWVGFHNRWLEYENVERAAGETKWSFWKLFLYALDGIIAFSTAPLLLSAAAGILFALVSMLAMVVIIVRKLLFGDPVAGWASTAVIILFVGSLQMMFVGILGGYLSKTYLEVKNRPIYICRETNLEGRKDDEK